VKHSVIPHVLLPSTASCLQVITKFGNGTRDFYRKCLWLWYVTAHFWQQFSINFVKSS